MGRLRERGANPGSMPNLMARFLISRRDGMGASRPEASIGIGGAVIDPIKADVDVSRHVLILASFFSAKCDEAISRIYQQTPRLSSPKAIRSAEATLTRLARS